MPGGNGTGPWWAGGNWMCRLGFGSGFRRGFGGGYGRGMGRGFGMGFGRGAYSTAQNQYYGQPRVSQEQEKSELKEYVMELEAELKETKKRISELEGKK